MLTGINLQEKIKLKCTVKVITSFPFFNNVIESTTDSRLPMYTYFIIVPHTVQTSRISLCIITFPCNFTSIELL